MVHAVIVLKFEEKIKIFFKLPYSCICFIKELFHKLDYHVAQQENNRSSHRESLLLGTFLFVYLF